MKKTCFLIFIVVLIWPFSLVNAQDKTVINLNYAVFFPASNHMAIATSEWAKEIEKRTNGKVKITVFPGTSLLTAPKIYEGVVMGTADIGLTCLSYTRGRFPLMEVLDMPLGYPNAKVTCKVMWEMYKKFKPKELADTKVLYIVTHEPGLISFTSPQINSLEKLKGKKIRSTGTAAQIVKELGGIPVAMTMQETYMALSKGIVDGTFGAFNTLKVERHAEVTKSSIYHPRVGYSTVMVIAMNLNKWNSLPADIKKVFDEVSDEWVDKTGIVSERAAQEGYDYSIAMEHKFIFLEDNPTELAKWVVHTEKIINQYEKNMEKLGLPGKVFVNEAKNMINHYGKMDKYRSDLKLSR